jgi:hypothetical protein
MILSYSIRLRALAKTEIELIELPNENPTLLSLLAISGVGKIKKRFITLIHTSEVEVRRCLASHSIGHRVLVRGRSPIRNNAMPIVAP